MATNTYVALDTKTVGTAVSSVTFTSISSGYTDLRLVINGGVTTLDNVVMRFNGDTASNYSATLMRGDGTSAISARSSNAAFIDWVTYIGTNVSSTVSTTDIMNYSNTTTYKTSISRGNVASNYVSASVGMWRNTAAINSITLISGSTNFLVGTTFTLYGIAAATPLTAKATGGTIYYGASDGYIYHKFTGTGTFTPTQSLTADILVVAGGGGATQYGQGGGGGAGGVLAFTNQSLSATNYTVTVGNGGATGSSTASNGGDSQFGALTLVKGGGFGGVYIPTPSTGGTGGTGGSGGGGGAFGGAGGSATSGQGYAGGSAAPNISQSDPQGGGGGGAGGAGQNGVGQATGYPQANGGGGIGTSAYSNWGLATSSGQNVSGTVYFAGGGGGHYGGPGGYGGGGNGDADGTANTGGGAGTNKSGGSGIVIVRYLG